MSSFLSALPPPPEEIGSNYFNLPHQEMSGPPSGPSGMPPGPPHPMSMPPPHGPPHGIPPMRIRGPPPPGRSLDYIYPQKTF